MGQLEHYFLGKRNLNIEPQKDKNETYTIEDFETEEDKTESNDNRHWEALDGESFRITKPTVFCFGGNKTLKPRNANYICAVAQSLLGMKQPKFKNEIATTEDIDFIGIAYGIDKTSGYGKNQKFSETSCLTEEEISELAVSIFAPLYLDDHMQIRSKEQILKNFSQITFFSHCHGAKEVSNLIHEVRYNMSAIGIDERTIEDAVGQLYSVSYAPWQVVPCPGLQVIPQKDNTLKRAPLLAKNSEDFLFNRQFCEQTGEGTVAFKENDNTISLIVSHITKQATDEHSIGYIERDDKWRIDTKDVAYGDKVSMAMGVALAYSIANSMQNRQNNHFIPKLTIDEMLKKIQSILGATQSREFANIVKQIQNTDNNMER